MIFRFFTLLLLLLLTTPGILAAPALRGMVGSGCTEVHCTATVCASSSSDSLEVASLGLLAIMGPDCAAWKDNGPSESPSDSKQCAPGKTAFTGKIAVWRAWTAEDHYVGNFAPDGGDFLGAECHGKERVHCEPKTKMFPSPVTGLCERMAGKNA